MKLQAFSFRKQPFPEKIHLEGRFALAESEKRQADSIEPDSHSSNEETS